MILHYYGHDLFTLTLSDGTVILTDPYENFYNYPNRSLRADICTVSHHHSDHDSVGILQEEKNLIHIIDTNGVHEPKKGIRIKGIPSFHDAENGALRGSNLIFVIEADGLRIVHLGDLGHTLSAAQIAMIGSPDILLLPVGGFYTIDAKTAFHVMQSLSPRITIPMHYRTAANPDMPVAPLADFLQLLHASPEPMHVCRITAEDISERPSLIVMTTPEGY